MSTLLLWAGVDSHGVASAYIATDSRLSNSPDLTEVWDVGQKAYCSTSAPLLAGYVGSSFYAAHLIPRLIAYGEAILSGAIDSHSFLTSLSEFTYTAISSAPPTHDSDFEVALAFRLDTGKFCFAVLSATPAGVDFRDLSIPIQSAIMHTSGTGAAFVHHKFNEWRQTNSADTSRAIYSAFCDALLHVNPPNTHLVPGKSKDPQSEGPPQLVGIYRKPGSPGKFFGTIWKGKLYFAGVETQELPTG